MCDISHIKYKHAEESLDFIQICELVMRIGICFDTAEPYHGVRDSILFLTLRTGKCLSKRHREVQSYLEKRSSTVSSVKSASLEKSSLDSRPLGE